jgi:hypothetical protein
MADNVPIDIIRSREEDLDRESAKQEQKSHPQSAPLDVDEDEKYKRDVAPDGGYGWVCVACVFWINAHTWGINSVGHISFPFTVTLLICLTTRATESF